MRLHQFGTIYQLAFLPHVFSINCYLVAEEKSLTLIDTGMSFCASEIIKTIHKFNLPLKTIILTHPHVDHVGALDAVKSTFPQATVCLSSRDTPLMNGDFALLPTESATPIRGGYNQQVKTRPTRLLQAGDRIGSLLAYAAPGHTPGEMVFYQAQSQTLIAGDALVVQGGLAVAGDRRWLFPFSADATWSLATSIDSVKRLNQLPIRYLMVGHGHVLVNANTKIETALRHAEARLRQRQSK